MASILCILLLLGNFAVFGYGVISPTIINKSIWSLRNNYRHERLKLPVPYVIIETLEVRDFSNGVHHCQDVMHMIEDSHVNNLGLTAIGHNFLVCEDGNVYEGRGWNVQGALYNDCNQRSIAIALVGNLRDAALHKRILTLLRQLIAYGVQENKIEKRYLVMGYQYNGVSSDPSNLLLPKLHEVDCWIPWTKCVTAKKSETQRCSVS